MRGCFGRGPSVKIGRNGKAAALTDAKLEQLLAETLSPRYAALRSIQRWTAARIGESLSLTWADLNGCVTFRVAMTKARTTRQVPMVAPLRQALSDYRAAWVAEHGHDPAPTEALFPAAGSTTTPQTQQAADKALRATCTGIGFEGVSTHSFRRSLAQAAVGRWVLVYVVQKMTRHKSLGSMGEYLAASDAEVLTAIEV